MSGCFVFELLIALRYNNQLHYVHTDIQGRPEIVTNSSKSIRWHAANTAFGRQIKTNYIDDLNLGFPGQYFDKEVGTWNNKRRDYDEVTGRYLQSDPLETVDGPNTYVYTGNSPLLRNDPTGEFW